MWLFIRIVTSANLFQQLVDWEFQWVKRQIVSYNEFNTNCEDMPHEEE